MTCKDCVHYEVCMDFTTLKESEFCQNYDKQEDLCEYFKNKSDFIELPCMCKDCQHFKFINLGGIVGICNLGDSQRSVGLEDYCSYGERKCDNG